MPRDPQHRSSVWLVGGATAFTLLGDQALYSTVPVYFDELGLRAVQVGIILSANRWIRLLTNEVAHRAVGRLDQRLLFAGAVALGAITTATYASTPGFALFLGARLAWGLAWSFIRHLSVLSVLEASGAERSGRSAGLLGGISRTGSIGGLLGGALLVDWLGFGPALAILSVVSLAALPLVWVGFVPVTGRAQGRSEADRTTATTRGLAFTHGMVGPGLVMATLGAVLDERLTTTGWWSAASLTGTVLAMRFLLESVAAPRLGGVTDRWGIHRAATGFFGLGSGALVVATLSPSLPLLIGAVVLFFVSGTALGAGLMGDSGRRGSRVLAHYVTANDLGAASGPLLGWIALAVFDERRLGLAIGAVLYALSALTARRLGESQKLSE
ncbi:MAG: MFS transporter [Actinomycetia bacterium]|nr:MFS transporter [Actinomycetes bacterium]MCP3909661.1 MFS transporter [Actinomycetes bacterium]